MAKILFLSVQNSRYYLEKRTKTPRITFPSSSILTDVIPKNVQKEFDNYVKKINQETIGLNSIMSHSIFPKFKSEYGFDPLLIRNSFFYDIGNYYPGEETVRHFSNDELVNLFNLNQNLNDEIIYKEIDFISNDLLDISRQILYIFDNSEIIKKEISQIFLSIDNAKERKRKALDCFKISGSLREIFSNYWEELLDDSVFSIDKLRKFPRFVADYLTLNNLSIFHLPLFKTSDGYIASLILINEALYHLAGDILNRKNKGGERISKEITKFYDEQYIPKLELFLSDRFEKVKVNLDLMNSYYPEIKNKLYNTKGIKKEIDILFVANKTLYIYDLKNYGIQHSLDECQKLLNRVQKELSKLKRTKNFILENITIFQSELHLEFDKIEIGILTSNTSIFEFTPNFFENFTIKSVEQFIQNLLNSKSDFKNFNSTQSRKIKNRINKKRKNK